MESLLAITTQQIIQILIFIAILAIVWAIITFILKLTIRMFAFGCGAILVLGLVLLVMRLLGRY